MKVQRARGHTSLLLNGQLSSSFCSPLADDSWLSLLSSPSSPMTGGEREMDCDRWREEGERERERMRECDGGEGRLEC